MNRKRFIMAAALGAITVALLAGGASGCPNSNTAGHDPVSGHPILKACGTEITDLPHAVTGNKVIVDTKSECDKPPAAHSVIITLLYHPRGATQFVTIASHQCTVRPLPGVPVNCRATEEPCRIGIWQVKALVTYSMPESAGGGDATYTPEESGASSYILKCKTHTK